MRRIKRALLWFVLLNKRLLRRKAFPALLILILLLSLGLGAAADGKGAFLTVALSAGDSASEELVGSLAEEHGALRCIVCDTPEEARAMVASGAADAAWLFSGRLDRELERHVSGRRAVAVTMVEREGNVFLSLSREKLYASLFPSISYLTFRSFLLRQTGAEEIPEEELSAWYHRTAIDREVIRIVHIDGAEAEENLPLLPLRGLLSILVMAGGLAAACFLLEDRRRGVFTWLSPGAAPWLSGVCVALPMLDLSMIALAALFLTGRAMGLLYELILMLLLVLAGAGFCCFAALLLRRAERVSVAALLLCVCMLALCPVFLSLPRLRFLSALFPPYWYLNAVHDSGSALALLLYAFAAVVLDYGLYRALHRREI